MDFKDPAAVEAVWRRVLQTQPENTTAQATSVRPSESQASEPTLPSALTEMISNALTARAEYLALSRCGGRSALCFQTLAQEAEGHARRLSALYFLTTGRKSCASRGAISSLAACGGANSAKPTIPHRCGAGWRAHSARAENVRILDAIRARYLASQAAESAYRSAAARWDAHAALFLSLAAAEPRHRARLHALLTDRL